MFSNHMFPQTIDKAYDSCYLLYKETIVTFESTFNRHLYQKFCNNLEEVLDENWMWDAESKTKDQGPFVAKMSFEHLISCSLEQIIIGFKATKA